MAGLPEININFIEAARTGIAMGDRGIVAVIIKGAGAPGMYKLTGPEQIPATWSEANREYITNAFLGNVTRPRSVLVAVIGASAENLTDALEMLATQYFDYLVAPPTCSETEAESVAAWVKERWAEQDCKRAVLPDCAADFEGVVNFTTTGIVLKSGKTKTAAEYCSRIAGLICGTPLSQSCTSAVLSEVSDVMRLTRAQMDEAVENGEFIIYNDGSKVKVGRGVTSLTTLANKSEQYQKVKIVDTLCQIRADISTTISDSYIGKFANSYDNKCVLITAISDYFKQLEAAGMLAQGYSSVSIDLAAQRKYITEHGGDVNDMSEDEIKQYPTGSQVFLAATIRVLDAIEDVTINIGI